MVFYLKQTKQAVLERLERTHDPNGPKLIDELCMDEMDDLPDLIAPPTIEAPSEQRPTFQVELLEGWRNP